MVQVERTVVHGCLGIRGTARSPVWLEQTNGGVRQGPEARSWNALGTIRRTATCLACSGEPWERSKQRSKRSISRSWGCCVDCNYRESMYTISIIRFVFWFGS